MNVLIVGLGSSGQRYARVLREMSPQYRIMVYRGEHRMGLINKSLKEINLNIDPVSYYNLEELSWIETCKRDYQLVIICTPVESHLHYARSLYQRSEKLIVEKPLCMSQGEIEEFNQIYGLMRGKVLVGYQHFYNPIFVEVSKQYASMKFAREIQISYLEPLAEMNPFRDMSTHHLSSPRGGGAMLALSHELDFLFRLEPEIFGKLSTSVGISMIHSKNRDSYTLSSNAQVGNVRSLDVKLSFAPGKNERWGFISDGQLEISWDLKAKSIAKRHAGIKETFTFEYSSDGLIRDLLQSYISNEISSIELDKRFNRAKQIVELSLL